jgi:hypothetical protein
VYLVTDHRVEDGVSMGKLSAYLIHSIFSGSTWACVTAEQCNQGMARNKQETKGANPLLLAFALWPVLGN